MMRYHGLNKSQTDAVGGETLGDTGRVSLSQPGPLVHSPTDRWHHSVRQESESARVRHGTWQGPLAVVLAVSNSKRLQLGIEFQTPFLAHQAAVYCVIRLHQALRRFTAAGTRGPPGGP